MRRFGNRISDQGSEFSRILLISCTRTRITRMSELVWHAFGNVATVLFKCVASRDRFATALNRTRVMGVP